LRSEDVVQVTARDARRRLAIEVSLS
jgi:hypothetical protein